MGLRWDCKVRITPANGVQTTIALDATTLVDGRGPVMIHPAYDPVDESEDDVLREIRHRHFGWRFKVDLGFAVRSMLAQATLAKIRDACNEPGTRIEWSQDAGANWRDVIGSGDFTPEAFNSKWRAGVRYGLTFTGKALLRKLPRIESVDGSGDSSVF